MNTSNRNILIFDIETVGDKLEELPDNIRSYLMQYADTEEKRAETVDSFSFNPLTSKIAAIGMMDYKSEKGCIMINTEEEIMLERTNENYTYLSGSETELLNKFWKIIYEKEYNLFVTFNGREFDCPFIMLRSIYHKIKPGCNLMRGSDYTFRENHIDLLKELTFFTHSGRGARRKFTLDFYCQKFGIKSPKSNGITGDMMNQLYDDKKFQVIADYCICDVIAERELFKFWNEYFDA